MFFPFLFDITSNAINDCSATSMHSMRFNWNKFHIKKFIQHYLFPEICPVLRQDDKEQ